MPIIIIRRKHAQQTHIDVRQLDLADIAAESLDRPDVLYIKGIRINNDNQVLNLPLVYWYPNPFFR